MSETEDSKPVIDPGEIKEDKLYPITVTCKGNHVFERTSGSEAKCRNCPLGYYLTPGMEITNGHITLHGELVI